MSLPTNLKNLRVDVLTLSTIMTSIWVALVLVSSSFLKLLTTLNPFSRLVRWMFDVETHPVRVLGLVAAGLVWVGSIVYGLV